MARDRSFHLHGGRGGSALAVRVIPRSKRAEIAEIMDDGTIKIRLTAPPVEGKANEALVKFLAGILDVPPSRIEIVAGHSGRKKLVTILDMDVSDAQALIEKCVAQK